MSIEENGLVLHMHPLSSYCWKALAALYELKTPFRSERIDGPPKSDPKLAALWPIGKMPLLFDAIRNQAVPEASIIIEYLQHHYPGDAVLIPQQPEEQIEVRLWDRFFDLYVHGPVQKLVYDHMRPDESKDPLGVQEARATLDIAYAMLEARLAARTWMAADSFTMADCAAAPSLFYAQTTHPFGRAHPRLAGYFERLIERPSVRRAIREARPYLLMFPLHAALAPRFLSPDF